MTNRKFAEKIDTSLIAGEKAKNSRPLSAAKDLLSYGAAISSGAQKKADPSLRSG